MSVWHATDAPNILHTSPAGTVSQVLSMRIHRPMEIDSRRSRDESATDDWRMSATRLPFVHQTNEKRFVLGYYLVRGCWMDHICEIRRLFDGRLVSDRIASIQPNQSFSLFWSVSAVSLVSRRTSRAPAKEKKKKGTKLICIRDRRPAENSRPELICARVESNDTTTGHSFNVVQQEAHGHCHSNQLLQQQQVDSSSQPKRRPFKRPKTSRGRGPIFSSQPDGPDSAILNRPLPPQQFFSFFLLLCGWKKENFFIFLSVAHLRPPAHAKEGGARPPFFSAKKKAADSILGPANLIVLWGVAKTT